MANIGGRGTRLICAGRARTGKLVCMAIHPRAGQPPCENELENLPRLVTAYYTTKPDPAVAAQKVGFGTS